MAKNNAGYIALGAFIVGTVLGGASGITLGAAVMRPHRDVQAPPLSLTPVERAPTCCAPVISDAYIAQLRQQLQARRDQERAGDARTDDAKLAEHQAYIDKMASGAAPRP